MVNRADGAQTQVAPAAAPARFASVTPRPFADGLLVDGCGSDGDCESVPAFVGALAGLIAEDGKVRTVGFSIGQGTLTGLVAAWR